MNCCVDGYKHTYYEYADKYSEYERRKQAEDFGIAKVRVVG
jgi:hypothetical protein